MDPADEFQSPYLYVGNNNPVRFIDPDGAQSTNAALWWLATKLATFDFDSWRTEKVGIADELTNIQNQKENLIVEEQAREIALKDIKLNSNLPDNIYVSAMYGKQSTRADVYWHGGFSLISSGIYAAGGRDINLSLGTFPASYSLAAGYTSTSDLTGSSIYFTAGALNIGIEGSVGLGMDLWPTWSLGFVGSTEMYWIGIGGTGYYPLHKFE